MQALSSNSSITPEVRSLVLSLEEFASREAVLAKIKNSAAQVMLLLKESPTKQSAAVEIDLSDITNVPSLLGTLRVAGFRQGFKAVNEVHPNSDQFTLSLSGKGKTVVEINDATRVDHYGEGSGNTISGKWHVAPRNQYHQHIAGAAQPWVVAAFHTAKDVITEYRQE